MNNIFETFSYIPNQKVRKAVVFLHGFGDSGAGVMPIASYIANKIGSNVAAFCPNAPQKAEGIEDGYQWFNAYSKNFVDYEGQLSTHKLIKKYIDEICETCKINWDDIILIGFSQGCMQAVFSSMRFTNKLYALVGIAGLLNWADKDMASFKNLPKTFICAGKLDDVMAPTYSKDMASIMKKNEVDVTLELYEDVDHLTVFNKAILPIIQFLK